MITRFRRGAFVKDVRTSGRILAIFPFVDPSCNVSIGNVLGRLVSMLRRTHPFEGRPLSNFGPIDLDHTSSDTLYVCRCLPQSCHRVSSEIHWVQRSPTSSSFVKVNIIRCVVFALDERTYIRVQQRKVQYFSRPSILALSALCLMFKSIHQIRKYCGVQRVRHRMRGYHLDVICHCLVQQELMAVDQNLDLTQ
jgi:hypothetical protein